MAAESWRVAQLAVERGPGDDRSLGSRYLVAPGPVLTAAQWCIDVSVPHDEAEPRIWPPGGGREGDLRRRGPRVLGPGRADGNEACITTRQGRDA